MGLPVFRAVPCRSPRGPPRRPGPAGARAQDASKNFELVHPFCGLTFFHCRITPNISQKVSARPRGLFVVYTLGKGI